MSQIPSVRQPKLYYRRPHWYFWVEWTDGKTGIIESQRFISKDDAKAYAAHAERAGWYHVQIVERPIDFRTKREGHATRKENSCSGPSYIRTA